MQAGYDSSTVELIEAHGTSTVVGDATEMASLSTAFQNIPAGESVAVGSIKSQIGHLKAAAGIAGLVKAIRAVHVTLGDGDKTPRGDEMKNREIARKSLVAAKEISKGERFSYENMTAKRPGTGRSPMSYWSYLGNVTTKSYCTDELID